MRDAAYGDVTSEEAMNLQAFLYANGELEGAEAAAFEKRLAEDQAAREALCQAVSLSLTLNHQRKIGPDPSYRDRVRQRLRRSGGWDWLLRPRTYRGHPALWSAVGAAAAVLLIMTLARLPAHLISQPHPPLPQPREPEEHVIPAPTPEPPQMAATEDMATIWANLHSTRNVTRAHDEEMRRKQRTDDRSRPIKPIERRPRPLTNQSPR
jgi:hypothetical protein